MTEPKIPPPLLQPAPATAMAGAPSGAPASAAPAVAYPPRWGVQTGFFQRRQPAFWLFVVLFALTILSVLSEQLLYLQYFGAGWFFSVVLLALYVIPVLLAIYILDPFEREPLSLIAAAFLWGGVISIGLAVVANSSLLEALAKLAGPRFAQTWGVALVAPPVEETFKFLGVVTIYLIARSEIDDLFDGFVYGAVIGVGFAAVENVQYFIQAIGQPGAGDQLGPVLQMFFIRAILVGAYMHAMWTGLSGVGFAYYVTQRDQPRQKRILVAAGLFALAVAAHVIWNSPLLNDLLSDFGGIFAFGLIKGLPFLGFLIVLVYLAQRRERRWFATITASDVGTDVLSQAELAELSSVRTRWAARRRVTARKGPHAGQLYGQLQREQINLGMIRSRVASDDDPAVVAQRDRIRAVRAQLNAIPDVPQPVAQQYAAASPTRPTMPTQPTAPSPPMAPSSPMAPGQPTQPATPSQPTTPIQPSAPAQPATPNRPMTQTQPVTQPLPASPPPPPPPTPVWMPTHAVPMTGMAAWQAPDPSRPPIAQLAPGVQLVIVEQTGAWARVVGSNGWSGWVDGRLLQRIG